MRTETKTDKKDYSRASAQGKRDDERKREADREVRRWK